MPRRRAWFLLVAVAAGCPTECEDTEGYYFSESGRWALSTDNLRTDPCDKPGSLGTQQDEPLLVGTRWCPGIRCTDCQGTSVSRVPGACYTSVVEGPGQGDGTCLDVTGSGALLWRFIPQPCDEQGIFLPEQVRLHAVGPGEVRGQLVSYLDAMALEHLSAGTGEFPGDAVRPADADLLRVAADQPVHVAVNLWAGERRVAWPAEASLTVEVLRGEAPVVRLDEHATALVQAPAGSEAALWLTIGATRIALGRVLGVASEDLRELELVVAYAHPSEDTDSLLPFAARAVARDAAGELVYGARAEWEVLAGSFPLVSLPFYAEDTNHDYILLLDPTAAEDEESYWCFPTPVTGARSYTGRISARVAGLHAEVDLAWTYRANAADTSTGSLDGKRPAPSCEGPGFDEPAGCDCTSTGQTAPPLTLLALVGLAARRRRARPALTP